MPIMNCQSMVSVLAAWLIVSGRGSRPPFCFTWPPRGTLLAYQADIAVPVLLWPRWVHPRGNGSASKPGTCCTAPTGRGYWLKSIAARQGASGASYLF